LKNILVLGTGFVAKPLVKYLANLKDIQLTVASNQIDEAKKLFENHTNAQTIQVDVNDNLGLSRLISKTDIVVSLVPYNYHPKIAKICLLQNAHLVTTSYVSKEMQFFDSDAKEKGLIFLNEMGLDPGIDHMSAMRMIKDIKQKGGSIKSFESCCGGFPAPESNTNPIHFKFSWSPHAVMRAGRNPAQYLKNGETVQIPANKAFTHFWQKKIPPLGELEVYPNRDSFRYIPIYGLDDVETFFRATLRYPGWSETMFNLAKLGYLNDQSNASLTNKTFTEITAKLIGQNSTESLKENVWQFLGLDCGPSILERLEWLGLFSSEIPQPGHSTLLDVLASQMLKKMSYKKGERDMVVLEHNFIAQTAAGQIEHINSLFINYGFPDGGSAMARCVGLPAAIATKQIAQEKLIISGVHIPVLPEIYGPVLEELETIGFIFKDQIKIIMDN
jgi:saccharopine dehydrogenase (NADP+, L-glutamate forming)